MIRACLAIAVVALPAAFAAGSHLDVTLTARGDAFFIGVVEGTLHEVGQFYTSENVTAGTALLHGYIEAGSYELWDRPYVEVATWGGSPLGLNEYRVTREPAIVDEGRLSGEVFVSSVDRPHIAAWVKDASRNVKHSDRVHISPLDDVRLEGTIPRGVVPRVVAEGLPQGAAWSSAFTPHEDVRLDGFVMWGASAAVGDQVFETGPRNGTAHASDPLGWSGAGEVHQYLLVVRVDEGHFEPLGAGWTIIASGFDGRLDGDLEVRRSVAKGTIGGAEIPQENHVFQAIGDFSARIEHARASSTWHLSGQASFVGANAETVAGDRFAHLVPAAAGAAFLLALGALLTKTGHALIFLLTGLGREEALKHPARRHLASIVEINPGATLPELAGTVGLSRAATLFHVKVLMRAQVVDIHRRGQRYHVMPNAGRFAFESDAGGAAIDAKAVAAVLNHPLRAALYDVLRAAGRPLRYAELCAKLPLDAKPARATVHHHARQLEAAGLVRREAAKATVQWSALPLERRQPVHGRKQADYAP